MGATYIKNHHGPTSVELGEIIKEMQKEGDLEAVKSQYFKYTGSIVLIYFSIIIRFILENSLVFILYK